MEQTDAISRSAALAIVDNLRDGSFYPVDLDWIARDINVLPALDVAPVVRCYECKYRCTQTCPMYHTEICLDDLDGFDSYDTDKTDDDGFCHLGARMEGEAE